MQSGEVKKADTANEKLSEMEKPFKGKGDIKEWDSDVLAKIDECFVRNYLDDDSGLPCASLFFPNSSDNHNRFTHYCSDVSKVLIHEDTSKFAPHARAYFNYAMIWKKHGYLFPMPLGTASVVQAVDYLATKYERGLCEVSPNIIISIQVTGSMRTFGP